MKIAVKNLDNEKVREIDLPDEIFAYPYKQHLIHLAVQARSWPACARARTRPRPAARSRARARSCGGRRAPVGRASAASAARSGARAAPSTVRCRATTPSTCRAARRRTRSSRRCRASSHEQQIVVVENLELDEPQDRGAAQAALGGLGDRGQGPAGRSPRQPEPRRSRRATTRAQDGRRARGQRLRRGRPARTWWSAKRRSAAWWRCWRNEDPGRSSAAR